jgi:hypothetical protein
VAPTLTTVFANAPYHWSSSSSLEGGGYTLLLTTLPFSTVTLLPLTTLPLNITTLLL